MSNDFILGSLAGIFFTVILGLLIREILKFDFKRLESYSMRGYINSKTFCVFFITIPLDVGFDLFMWTSINDKIDNYNFVILIVFILLVPLTIFMDFQNTQKKKKSIVERITFNLSAHLGLFSLTIGLACCMHGWNKTEDSLLTYGGIYISFSSFWIMLFIALTQFLENQQKDKPV